MLEELTAPSQGRPTSGLVRVMRSFGLIALAFVVVGALTNPGDAPLVALALVVFLVGLLVSLQRRPLPPGVRAAALVALGAGSCALTALQPNGAAIGGIYVTVIIAAMRLQLPVAAAISGAAVAAEAVILAVTVDKPVGAVLSLTLSIIPWFMVARLLRELREGKERAEGLVEELQESRAAHAQSVALAERARVAREMHDVLAHSLSALALQLEGARLLATDRGADPEVVDAIERAHHLAAGGLDEARGSIAALRGEELPGPERLDALVEAFREHSRARVDATVTGEPIALGSDARLAVYRTAQEALTNIRKHSAADRVEVRLAYEPGGVTLVVSDHGPGAPVAVGATGRGYGLTGMRERAELLGGRLTAGPTADGFRVELWLPA